MLGRMGRAAGAFAGGALSGCNLSLGTPTAPSTTRSRGARRGDRLGRVVEAPTADEPLELRQLALLHRHRAGNRHPSLERFQEETGIHVHYFRTISGNDSFMLEIQPYLEAGVPPSTT